MKQKDNRSTGALVVSLTFAVVVFTALYIQHQSANEPVKIVKNPLVLEDVFASNLEANDESFDLETETVNEEIITQDPPGVISFVKAYAIARDALGPNQTFTWNGSEYSTNTAEEAATLAAKDPTEINITDTQDSLVDALSHAITPEL